MHENIQVFNKNPLGENTYLFNYQDTLLIVDPGVPVKEFSLSIDKYNPQNIKILYTHGHFDHIAFGADLEEYLFKKNISYLSYTGQEEKNYFTKEGFNLFTQSIYKYGVAGYYSSNKLPKINEYLKDGDSIGLLDFMFYHTPGHTKGGGVFYSIQENILFTGDTIFANGSIGRIDFPDSLPGKMSQSIDRIFELFPKQTVIYPGHGSYSTIKQELKIHKINN